MQDTKADKLRKSLKSKWYVGLNVMVQSIDLCTDLNLN